MIQWVDCSQCGQRINTALSSHAIFRMNDGSVRYAHYDRNGGCGKHYQTEHYSDIESSHKVFPRSKKEVIEPKDYAT